MITYNLEFFNENLQCWEFSGFTPTGGFTSKQEGLNAKQRAERINSHLEYKLIEIVNDKLDPIGHSIRTILDKYK